MTKDTYMRMTEPLREDPKLARGIHIANKILTGAVFLSYPLLLVWLLFRIRQGELAAGSAALVRAICVPLDSFLMVTVFRYLWNSPRPYEVFEMEPVIPKDTRGKSFPSRHVFSVFIIAMTYLAAAPSLWMGVMLLAAGVLLGAVRVISGVHFPKDVLAGAICGIVAGLLGFWVL